MSTEQESSSSKLKRATQLWHAALALTGQRFDLLRFIADADYEQVTLAGINGSAQTELVAAADAWRRGPDKAATKTSGQEGAAALPPAAFADAVPHKPRKRYLNGVR
jgi:hypothetical protein